MLIASFMDSNEQQSKFKLMETRNSKELAEVIQKAIDDYRNTFADCMPLDIQLALQKVMEENQ